MASQTAPENQGQRILKKLTIRDLIGGKAEILAVAMLGRPKLKDEEGKDVLGTNGKPVPLARFIGQVTNVRADESDNGPFVELRGIFGAMNLQTGEVIENVTRCILPNAIGEPIAEAIKGGAAAADFAVEVSVRYEETAATMYVFEARSLMKPQTAKPLQGIMAQLLESGVKMTAPKMLAAPELSDADRKAQTAKAKEADAQKAAAKAAADKEAAKAAGAKV